MAPPSHGLTIEPHEEASWPMWPGRLALVWNANRHLWRVDLAGTSCLFAYQVKGGVAPEDFAFTWGEA